MKKLLSKILPLVSAIATLVATLGVSTASTWVLYQPKEPKCLKK